MATALANVSDDWVQRAFAAELGGKSVGGGKGVGGTPSMQDAKAAIGSAMGGAFSNPVGVIGVFLAWCALSITVATATPKHGGANTSHLGRFLIFSSVIEIILYMVCLYGFYSTLGEDTEQSKIIFLLNWVMFASISSGLHVALLTKEQKLTILNDRFFNGIRIICQCGILVGLIYTYESMREKAIPIGVFAAIFIAGSMGIAIAKKNKKTVIGVLAFLVVLGYTALAILLFMWNK